MQGMILGLLLTPVFTPALAVAQEPQLFIGTITDTECANGDHSQMRMGSTDAECTTACIFAHGAMYVLFDGDEVYVLSDQQAPAEFAGRKVRVTGTVDAETKTIHLDSIEAAE